MPIKVYNPTTPGRRNSSVQDFSDVTRMKPEKSLSRRIKKHGGRSCSGETNTSFRGGGARKIYRKIDFKRTKDNIPAKVAQIEYDPNRNCRIALLHYADGFKSYILAPDGVKVGEILMSGTAVEPKPGNCMPMINIPAGLEVHNLEMEPGYGGQIVRGAGLSATLLAKEGKTVVVTLPSGEMRRLNAKCRATIGKVGNSDYQNVRWGKAGRRRHLGWKPHQRGVSMNPQDHPMGGGKGRTHGGRQPVSPNGVPSKGGRTRKPRNASNKAIIRRRKSRRYGEVKIKH